MEELKKMYNLKNENLKDFYDLLSVIKSSEYKDENLLCQLNRTLINYIVNNTTKKYLIILLDYYSLDDKTVYLLNENDKIIFFDFCEIIIKFINSNETNFPNFDFQIEILKNLNYELKNYFNEKITNKIIGNTSYLKIYNELMIYKLPYDCKIDNFDKFQMGINILNKMLETNQYSFRYFIFKKYHFDILQSRDILKLDYILHEYEFLYDINESKTDSDNLKYGIVLGSGVVISLLLYNKFV
jgi:hypothetical protein